MNKTQYRSIALAFIACVAICPNASLGQAKKKAPKESNEAKQNIPALVIVIDVGKDGKPRNPVVKQSTLPPEDRERIETVAMSGIKEKIQFPRSAAGSHKSLAFVRLKGELESYISTKNILAIEWAIKSGEIPYELKLFPGVKPYKTTQTSKEVVTGKQVDVFEIPRGEHEVIGVLTNKTIQALEINKLSAPPQSR